MRNNPNMRKTWFLEKIESQIDSDLLYESRVHPIGHLGGGIFAKREDESGFGTSGTKRRKFASLIPFLIKNKIELSLLVGGAHSNHILSLIQLMREYQLPFKLFLKTNKQLNIQGNAFLIRLLEEEKEINFISGNDWPQVVEITNAFGQMSGKAWHLIPEGGMCQEAIPGLCTLMLDIERNEEQVGHSFEHIWIDAGTGLTAAVLVAMNLLFKRKSLIHVVLMADDVSYFQGVYRQVSIWLTDLFQMDIPALSQCQFHFPPTAKSFGSANSSIKQFIVEFARKSGILTDPVYTAKLFLTAQTNILKEPQKASHLIIHSGGGTGLMGFSEQLLKHI